MSLTTFWLIIAGLYVIAEIVTHRALISIWFSISAAIAALAAGCGAPFVIQALLFVAISLGLYFGTKSWVKNRKTKNNENLEVAEDLKKED